MTAETKGACAKDKPYHHGNLRDALILAAADLIRERASVDFAMVDAARRAGVSSAAPYRHFKDRDALLEAVCHVAFMALTESTREIAARVDTGTEEGIIAIGKGYVDFVTSHPEFYDLMWGDMGLRTLESVDEGVKNSGFYVLVDSVSNWCATHGVSDYNATELAVKLWATAHGLACLTMNRSLDNFLPGVDSRALLDSTTRTFLEGLRQGTTG